MSYEAVLAAIGVQWKTRMRSYAGLVGTLLPAAISGAMIATAIPSLSAAQIFALVLAALWTGGSAAVREIVDDRPVMARDRDLNLLSYGVSKLIYAAVLAASHAAVLVLCVTIVGRTVVSPTGLWAILSVTALCGSLLGLIVSACCDQPATALRWFPLILIPQLLFGGLLIHVAGTKPFIWDSETGAATDVPERLQPRVTHDLGVRIPAALVVSRWAAEAVAALELREPPDSITAIRQAVHLLGTQPLTLAGTGPSEVLRNALTGPGPHTKLPAPLQTRFVWEYGAILVLFVSAKTTLFFVVLMLRDPRPRWVPVTLDWPLDVSRGEPSDPEIRKPGPSSK